MSLLHTTELKKPEIRLVTATLTFCSRLIFQMERVLFIMASAQNQLCKQDTINRNITQSTKKTVNNLVVCTVSNRCHIPPYLPPAASVSLQPRIPRHTVWEPSLCTITQVCACTLSLGFHEPFPQ